MKLSWSECLLAITFCSFQVPFSHQLNGVVHTGTNYSKTTGELKLCQCDMTGGICDVYCCCDQDCSEETLQAFSCQYSEDSTPLDSSLWKCTNLNTHHDLGLISLLCVEKENSPYLGHFFPNQPLLRDLPSLNDLFLRKVNSFRNSITSFSADKSEGNSMKAFTATKGYVFGQELQIIPSKLHSNRLLLPFNIYSGYCDSTYPVQFLKEISSSCAIEVRRYCSSPFMSLLDARTFVLGSRSMKRLLRASGEESIVQNVTITYFYSTQPCCYLKSKNCVNTSYTCENKLLQPLASIDYLHPNFYENVCNNSVLEVSYTFIWIGGWIDSANIKIVLGNISAASDSLLMQRFSVTFEHMNHLKTREIETETNQTRNHMRNRNTGYQIGNKLIGLIYNNSVRGSEILYGNSSLTNHLYLWKSEVGGNCILDSHPVTFRVDKLSGCYYEVRNWSSVNCSQIRSDVLDMQSKLLQVDFLSTGRNPDLDNIDHFVQIIKPEVPQSNENQDEDTFPWKLGACNHVPYHVFLDIAVAEAGRVRNRPIYRIAGAILRYKVTTWKPPHDNFSTKFLLLSTVRFSLFSTEEESKKRRTKRFWLSADPVSQCAEESCWEEIFFPWRWIAFDNSGDRLWIATHCAILLVVLVASSVFLLRLKGYAPH